MTIEYDNFLDNVFDDGSVLDDNFIDSTMYAGMNTIDVNNAIKENPLKSVETTTQKQGYKKYKKSCLFINYNTHYFFRRLCIIGK